MYKYKNQTNYINMNNYCNISIRSKQKKSDSEKKRLDTGKNKIRCSLKM